MLTAASQDNPPDAWGEPKYRVCRSSLGSFVVFFCDWDWLCYETSHFLGKPILLSTHKWPHAIGRRIVIEPFGEFVDVLKSSRPLSYCSDIGLNRLLALFAPDLCTASALPGLPLCLARFDSVKRTLTASELLDQSVNSAPSELRRRISLLRQAVHPAPMGLVGSTPLRLVSGRDKTITDSDLADADIDAVVTVDSPSDGWDMLRRIKAIPDTATTPTLRELWPLSLSLRDIGSVDLFFCLRHIPQSLSLLLKPEGDAVQDVHFAEQVADSSLSILGAPIWRLESGRVLVSTDNALRARFIAPARIVGHAALYRSMCGSEVLFVADGNLVRTRLESYE